MKAYLMGALFGILLMLGVTVLYGLTGATRYPQLEMGPGRRSGGEPSRPEWSVVGVLAGLMFDAGGVLTHFWVARRCAGRQRHRGNVSDHRAQDRGPGGAVPPHHCPPDRPGLADAHRRVLPSSL